MNKTALRSEYIAKGYKVDEVEKWRLVSSIAGVVKYDVNVVTPDNRFITSQVVVEEDGTANESAVADGQWKEVEPVTTFTERLGSYIRTLEKGTIFAIAAKEVFETDAVATVNVYFTDKSTKTFAVKERAGTFSYQELT